MNIRSAQSIILTLFCLISVNLSAQQPGGKGGYGSYSGSGATGDMVGSLKGVVVNSATSKPLAYAYLVLHKIIDSTLVTGGITDTAGRFKIEKVPYGKYYISITLIGHKPQKISNVFLGPKNPDKVLDTIKMDQSSAMLDAVEIKDKKVDVEYTLDKKIVNVEKSLVSTGGSAVDIMKSIPSITVDIDGNVSLKGSTNITVLVDGKPSGITGASRSAILEQIPASSIESIELISNPSAKYDPDGMSGIINIVLKKKKERGYHAVVTVNAGTHDKYNGSVALNYSKGKFNVFANYDARLNNSSGWGDMKRFTHYDTIHQTDSTYVLNSDSTILSHSTSSRKGISQNIKLGTDFYLNDKNTITVSGLYSLSNDNHSDLSKVSTLNSTEQVANYYISPSTENSKDNSLDLNFDYKRTFAKKGEYITADATLSNSHGTENGNQNYYFYMPDLVTPLNVPPELQRTTTTDHNKITTLQADYSNTLSKKSKFEAGIKSIIRSIDNDYVFRSYEPSLDNWTDTLPSLSNRFLYDEQIHAVYGTYSNAIGIFEFQTGLRAEMAFTKSTQKTTNQEFKKNYYSLFPSVHMNLNLKNDNSLQLSYSRRVNRPNYYMLNPFVEISIKNVRRYGNPYLTPEYIDSYELGHMKYWKHTSINSSVFYKQINHAIQRITIVTQNGMDMTSNNIASGTSYGLEFILTQDFFTWWKANGTFSYFKTVMKGTEDQSNLTNSNYSWTAKINTTMTILKNLDIQLTGNYRSPTVTLQGGMKAMYSSDLAMKKVIFKNASLTLRLSDIFNTQKMRMNSTSYNTLSGITNTVENTRKRESRVLYLGFTYKINGGVKSKSGKRSIEGTDDSEGNDL